MPYRERELVEALRIELLKQSLSISPEIIVWIDGSSVITKVFRRCHDLL